MTYFFGKLNQILCLMLLSVCNFSKNQGQTSINYSTDPIFLKNVILKDVQHQENFCI